MEKILSSKEMSYADKMTSEVLGIDSFTLMERAALETAHFICDKFRTKKIAVFSGIGNNGGDGIALARILKELDVDVNLFVIGDISKASPLVTRQLNILKALSIEYFQGIESNNLDFDVYVDGLFGIGLNRDISGEYYDVIQVINNRTGVKISIDIPSGINADTGNIMGIAVKCDYTITYGAKKLGHILFPGREYSGEVICRKIGIPVEKFGNYNNFILDKSDVLFPNRAVSGNKGTFGKVLLIAGSKNMGGAAILSAKAVLHSGAGMVKVLTTIENRDLILKAIPEAMVDTYGDIFDFKEKMQSGLKWCDVVAIGPGLSTDEIADKIIKELLNLVDKPIVFDADALNIIARNDSYIEKIKSLTYKAIFTPHIGEFSRLCKKEISDIKFECVNYCKEYANKCNIILVCKDACTVVTDGDRVFYNTSGNDGMATAGSGDVLTGIIASLLAQKEELFDAASKGVFIHGRAGDVAKEKTSAYYIIANDIIDSLANIF